MLTAILIFLLLLALGMPIAFAIGISGASFFLLSGLPLTVAVQQSISTTQSVTMLAIPLFIFAGNLMNNTGITTRLVKVSEVLVGHMHGSLGQVSCVLSAMMGGVSGSAVADAAMETRILGPQMERLGYAKGWAAAVNGITGLIVATIPPSMGLIIYGTVGEVSIGRLFAGGYIPGLMMMVAFMIATDISARHFGFKPQRAERASFKEAMIALWEGIFALIFPILLIVLIRFGIMSPTESGAFAVAYAMFVGMFIYKELTPQLFIKTLQDSVRDIAVVVLILAFSGTFAYGVVYDSLPQFVAGILINITSNAKILLFLIILFLTICGMFMETTVITLILTPILLPVVKQMGVDPVHFGLIMMTTVTAGVMTPPVGNALYVTSGIMGCKVEETAKYCIPYYIALLTVLAIVVFFPQLVLWLPNMIFG